MLQSSFWHGSVRKVGVGTKTLSKRRRCLDRNISAMAFFGFWPSRSRKERSLLFYCRYWYPRVQLFRAGYSVVFQAINISLVWGDIASMTEHFLMMLIYSMAAVKTWTMFYNQKKLNSIVSTLRDLHSPRMLSYEHLKLQAAKTDRFADMHTEYFFINTIFISPVGAVVQIIQGLMTRTIPFRRWFPYNAEASPMFEITLFFTMFATMFDFIAIVICDMLFIALSIHIVGQFKLLTHKIENLRENVETIMKRKGQVTLITECFGRNASKLRATEMPMPSVEYLSMTQDVTYNSSDHSGPIVRQDTIMNEMEAGSLDRPKRETRGQEVRGRQRNRRIADLGATEITVRGNSTETEVKMKRETRAQEVRGRQRNRRIADLGATWSMDLKNTTENEAKMEDFLNQCVKQHQILIRLCRDLGSSFKEMLSFQVLCNILCGLVALYITTLSWKVRDAVYDCDWFGASKSFKRSMQIMISRTNRPIIIRAGGLPLSMRMYKKIYKVSYYLHMVLSKLFHGEKIIKS